MQLEPAAKMDACSESFDRAFVDFYQATKAQVFGFVLARCGHPDLAEEVLAETYLAAIGALRTGSVEQMTIAWLFTVARRRLIDHWRREASSRSKIEMLGAVQGVAFGEFETDHKIMEALAALPERQRAAVSLRYLDEYSVGEIADVLDVTYKTAESLLSRGRSSLRRAYKEAARDA